MSLLESLNPRQREAVLQTEGPVQVLAGAGSGKTRVIVTRVAYLIAERKVPPDAILAVTFTNKAADEMRERVQALLRDVGIDIDRGPKPWVRTFHSFCVRLLRQYAESLAGSRPGFTPRFLIFDSSDQLAVVKAAMQELDLDTRHFKPRSALAAISRLKNQGYRSMPRSEVRNPDDEDLRDVFRLYRERLLAANALDFDDLILEAVALLRASEPVRSRVRSRHRYLMVDEYQDTNRPQYELLRLLAGQTRNVCVVGDEDQAIYSWRGADIRNILEFEKDFPTAKTIRLEQNYRSTGTILDAAAAVVAHNAKRRGKRLWTAGPAGEQPVLYEARDAGAEARFVARTAHRLCSTDPDVRVGVLYRVNAQSRQLEEALRRQGLDFRVVGGVAFYDRKEVKDLLAYVKAALAPNDELNLRRIINVPARGIGRATLDRLTAYARRRGISLWVAIEECLQANRMPPRAGNSLRAFRRLMEGLRKKLDVLPPADLLGWTYRESGYHDMLLADGSPEAETRMENVDELMTAASEADDEGASLSDFLDYAALVSDSDGIDEQAPIQLMTLHTAKGLEFPAVILVGLEEKLLPHVRSMEDPFGDGVEEERRLFYVGMTRAQRYLVLTCAEERRLYGAGDPQSTERSRFLDEIPPGLLQDESPGYRSGYRWRQEPAPHPSRGGRQGRRANRPGPSRSGPPGGLNTHDSVSAVARFFKSRGIPVKVPDSPAPSANGRKQPAGAGRPRSASRARRGPSAAPGSLERGTRVRHSKFGEGVVRRREGDGPAAKLTVYFPRHGLKKLVARYANLVKL